MTFVDSGFLIGMFEKNDELHARAGRWSKHLAEAGESLLTTEFVLLETYNHFSKPWDRPRVPFIHRMVMVNANLAVLGLSSDLFAEGLAFHRTHADKAWSLTDCISFHVMREHGVRQALAFDHHFEQAGFEALLRRDP